MLKASEVIVVKIQKMSDELVKLTSYQIDWMWVNVVIDICSGECFTKTDFELLRFSGMCCCLEGSQTTMSFMRMYLTVPLFETNIRCCLDEKQ